MQRTIRKLPPKYIPEVQTKRVAAYARVSDGKFAMLESLAAQTSYYSRFIQNHSGWEYAGVFFDEGVTGTKAERKGFQDMLTACREGKVDMVITKSISRFARNTLTLLETTRELKGLGVDVFFEKQNIHTQSAEGEIMLTLLAACAQEESRVVSDNCKWRIRKGFAKGRVWAVQPYGYRIVEGQYIVHQDEAVVVKGIFAAYAAGIGINGITRMLNQAGIPFTNGRRWNESTVHKLLRNERYCGDMLLQKTFVADPISKRKRRNAGKLPQYFVEGDHEAIIPRELFDAVQRRLKQRARMNRPAASIPPYTYPFSGLLVCGICGKPYRRKINSAGTKYAKPVWICRTYNQFGKEHCASRQIPEDILTRIVNDVLQSNALSRESLLRIEVGTANDVLQSNALSRESLLRIEVGTANDALQCDALSRELLQKALLRIEVGAGNLLTFCFKDGRTIMREWQLPSRRDSWNSEARQRAREHNLRRSST